MKLQSKIFLLYIFITLIFFSGIIVFFVLQNREQHFYLREKLIDDKSLVENFMTFNSKSFLSPIKNNSEWSELIAFTKSPDYTWGLNNLSILIQDFNYSYVWLYNTSLKRVFYADTDNIEANNIYLSKDDVSRLFKNGNLTHTFIKKGNLLIELYGATIVPEDDPNHITKAKGYIIGGKLWDENYIREVSKLSGFAITVNLDKDTNETSGYTESQKEVVLYELTDIYGDHIGSLKFYKTEHFLKDLSNTIKISLVLLIVSVVTLLFCLFKIKRWINDPIRDIIRSLDEEDAHYLKKLKLKKTEFGRVSELIDHFYYQKDLLLQEIEVRKKTEIELCEAKEVAESANKEKSGFMANMSHEIRNPLNAIIGLSNSLARSDLNEQAKEIINYIKISSNHLLNIVNDILDFSKIEANKVELCNNNFEVRKLVSELYSSFKTSAASRNLHLSYNIESDIPIYLQGDDIKFRQIIINLVGNAIKFTEKGSVSISLKCDKNENEKVFILTEVSDTGIGIKEKDFERLFQSFTQLDNSSTKKYSGTGLGLAIVKRYTDLMGGTVIFSSEFGKGSAFAIRMPFNLPDKVITTPQQIDASLDLPKTKLKILLAEDDGINQFYLKGFLTGKGFLVDTACNGMQALEKFNINQYDLILMDGQMPSMDGFETTRRIRKREKENLTNSHIPIIALSGYALSGDKDKFLDSGMDDYISKPIDETILINLFQKYL